MRINKIILVLCFIIPSVYGQTLTPEDFIRQTGLRKEFEAAQNSLRYFPDGRGTVVYGQLAIAPETRKDIVSRVRVYPSGYFVAAIYEGRSLCFYRHGYEPIQIAVDSQSPRSMDVGKLQFKPMAADKTFSISGKIKVSPELKSAKFTVSLIIPMPPQIFNDDGYQCGAVVAHKVADQIITAEQSYHFAGLLPIKYLLEIKSEKSILRQIFFYPTGLGNEYSFTVEENKSWPAAKHIVLPEVSLVMAPIVQFKLRLCKISDLHPQPGQAPEEKRTPPEFLPEIKTFIRKCDGTTVVPLGQQREYYSRDQYFLRDHTLNLTIDERNRVIASFSFGASYFYDCGNVSLAATEKMINADFMKQSRAPRYYSYRVGDEVVSTTVAKFKEEMPLEDGHTYYFECSMEQIYLLLRVDTIKTPDAAQPAGKKQ